MWTNITHWLLLLFSRLSLSWRKTLKSLCDNQQQITNIKKYEPRKKKSISHIHIALTYQIDQQWVGWLVGGGCTNMDWVVGNKLTCSNIICLKINRFLRFFFLVFFFSCIKIHEPHFVHANSVFFFLLLKMSIQFCKMNISICVLKLSKQKLSQHTHKHNGEKGWKRKCSMKFLNIFHWLCAILLKAFCYFDFIKFVWLKTTEISCACRISAQRYALLKIQYNVIFIYMYITIYTYIAHTHLYIFFGVVVEAARISANLKKK